MTRDEAPGAEPTPHLREVDVTPLRGAMVLGEPLEVLFSAVLRFRFGEPRDGLVPVGATLPNDEAEALVRAMGRVERDVPGDCRTRGQRDCDRLVAVTQRVLETVAAVHAVTDTGAA